MSSFKEKINEITSDLGGRIKNPLILSFIFVWLYQNWSLIFIYFNLNPTFSFGEKLFILRIYINSYGFKGLFWNPLLYAFFSLIIYYLIAITAQLVKLIVGERFNAAIILYFDKSKYILRTIHKKTLEVNRELKIKEGELESEIEINKSKLRQKDAELEETRKKNSERISEKDSELGTLKGEIFNLQNEKFELSGKLERETANSDLISDQIKLLMKKEIDVNVELERLREDAFKFKSSEEVFDMLTVLDGKVAYGHLSLDQHTVLVIIFGNIKWDVVDEKQISLETFIYERGYFISPNRSESFRISNVSFDDGVLIFNKMSMVSPGISLKETIVKLKIDNKHELYGFEDERKVKYIHSKSF
jgi:hypothetical protein